MQALTTRRPITRALRRGALAATSAVLTLAAAIPAAHAAPSTALHPRTVKLTSSTIPSGGTTQASVSLKGSGRGSLALLLSRDARRDTRDQRLGRATTLRARRGRAAVAIRVQIPATAAGRYQLLACVARHCAASAPFTVTTAQSNPPAQGVPTPAPAPAGLPTIAVVPDGPINATATKGGGTATKSFGAAGGTLSTTDAHGRTYTLTIPAGAVPDGTTITMTPIASLAGTPVDARFTAGVVFEPEGLQLYKAGSLTIDGIAAPSAQLAFSADGTGAGFHAAPMTPDSSRIEIPVTHFSSDGVVNDADGAASDALSKHPPASTLAELDQEIGLILQEARSGKRSGDDAMSAVKDQVDRYWTNVLQPGMNQHRGYDDDDTATAFIKELLTWARMQALLNGGDGDLASNGIGPYVTTLIERSYARHQQRCRTAHDLDEINTIIARDRDLQLLGDTSHTLDDDVSCFGFKVHIDSLITATGATTGTWHLHGDATLQLQPGIQLVAAGPGAMTWDSFSFAHQETHQGCTETWTPATTSGDALNVSSLRAMVDGAGKLDHFEVALDPGQPHEHYDLTYSGTGCGANDTLSLTNWRDYFDSFHALDFHNGGLVFEIPRTGDGSATVGSVTFQPPPIPVDDPSGAFTLSETTTIQVVHHPS